MGGGVLDSRDAALVWKPASEVRVVRLFFIFFLAFVVALLLPVVLHAI